MKDIQLRHKLLISTDIKELIKERIMIEPVRQALKVNDFTTAFYLLNERYPSVGCAYIRFLTEACLAADIDILRGLNKIWGYQFYNNVVITSITIPSNIEWIETYAFSGCINLKEIKFEEGIQEIWSCAFTAVPVQKVILPKSITYVSPGAFPRFTEVIRK